MGFEVAAAAISMAGTAFSAVSQMQAGGEQKKWANYNAAVAERDAETARKVANYEASLARKGTEEL
jgi:hypothetical protein